ncbi:DUF2065 domain-containing protein [Lacimicrobium sp. SS2-24]|uniref:DUF2065 domain-containing protein n=1 Tax=Lacimicrobium sp. SS2-24 TaxID=2005569 RepID=UPI0014387636|nr:DUF2065 domain-containing protein [Lacimicrobium sp. SS2-24]
MSDAIWLALAMVLIIEGIGPMLFPNRWQHYVRTLADQSPQQLRTLGGVMVIIGVVTVFYLL